MQRAGEIWHIPVYEDELTKEKFIRLKDFKDIEKDMYEHLVASINLYGTTEKSFKEFERRNGLKMFEHISHINGQK